MTQWKNIKRTIAAASAFCLAAGCLFSLGGCGKGSSDEDMITDTGSPEENPAVTEAGKAMGRYLEEDVPLPEGCTTVESLQFLEDGSLAMLYRDNDYRACFTKSADKGETWEPGASVSELMGLPAQDGDQFMNMCIAKDGSIFAGTYTSDGDSGDYRTDCYYYSSKDGPKKLELPDLSGSGLVMSSQINEDGNLFLSILGNGILEINPFDCSLVHTYEDDSHVEFMGVTEKNLAAVTGGTVHYYDTETGSPIDGCDALTQQIASDPSNLENNTTSSVPILFLSGDEKDSIFYVDHSGMYRYAFGGNVVEQIIDGSLNSIGSPNTGFSSITKGEDGSFYIGSNNFSSGNSQGNLFRYVYSKDTPSVPDTELKVYALKDNSLIRQATAIFQKKHPDIYLNVEVGMTGDDAVISTDALKNLNTEIMADKSPDILIMDGIPADTYMEKGLLEDLSGIVKEAGLLSNIQNAYTQEDGSIYTMPVKFGIPMLLGHREDMETVTDLTSMADVIESHREEYKVGDGNSFYYLPLSSCFGPQMTLESLADTSSAAWMNDDGTLDEALVKDFLEQTERIYQAGTNCLSELTEQYGIDLSEMGGYDRSVGINGTSAVENLFTFSIGGIYSPLDVAQLDSVEKADSSIVSKLWNGQAQNCFIPVTTVGISAKSTEKEAAEKFIRFLFSEDGQKITRFGGFPVNQKVYESEAYWDQGEEGTTIMTTSSYNSKTGTDTTFYVNAPSWEVVKGYQDLGKTLTTPAADNAIIQSAVTDAGIRYLSGEISLDEAADSVMQEVNLYLSE